VRLDRALKELVSPDSGKRHIRKNDKAERYRQRLKRRQQIIDHITERIARAFDSEEFRQQFKEYKRYVDELLSDDSNDLPNDIVSSIPVVSDTQ